MEDRPLKRKSSSSEAISMFAVASVALISFFYQHFSLSFPRPQRRRAEDGKRHFLTNVARDYIRRTRLGAEGHTSCSFGKIRWKA